MASSVGAEGTRLAEHRHRPKGGRWNENGRVWSYDNRWNALWREVEVSFGTRAFGGLTVTTHVAAPVAQPFKVKGGDSGWQSKPMPQAVLDTLQKFAPLDRHIRVRGGSGGIWVERDRSSMEATSARGTVNWFKDLQLAEKLADALR